MSSPIAEIIARFGGVRATARAMQAHPMTVSHWKRKGQLPPDRAAALERAAKAADVQVTRDEVLAAVMHGREEAA